MKKEDVSGVIVYLLILVLAVVFGLTVLQKHQSESYFDEQNLFILYIIISIVIGVIFNAVIFELGHILGAKIGGYFVTSTSILGFTFYKNEKGERKFKLGNFDGLTGETKIVPDYNNKKGKEPNPMAYLWFGTLLFIAEIIIIIFTFVFLNSAAVKVGDSSAAAIEQAEKLKDGAYFLLIVGVIGFMILIYNILPFKLDAMTDGYRLTLVSNPKNKVAFNELLRVEHEIELGNKNVEIKTFDEITNFTADLNLNKVYILLDNNKFKEAEELIDMIINSKESVSEKVYIRAKAQKVYINLMTKEIEDARTFYKETLDVSETRIIANDASMASIRAYLLVSGLLDKSRSECVVALEKVGKAFKRTPKNRQQTELTLFNCALKKVCESHPSWELEDYMLVENKK